MTEAQKKRNPIVRKPAQRLEAVQLYLMFGGNVGKTAGALKIPEQTIYAWRKTDWWHEMEEACRTEENLELSSKLKKIIEKSSSIILDRLENGDWIYDQKTGQMVRKPVAMKDAQKTVNDFIDKREKLNRTQSHTVAQEHIEDKLAKLAQAFTELAKPKQPIQVTDVIFAEEQVEEITNALDD